jgi:hypothetical protein
MYEQKDDPYQIDETTVALIELSPSQKQAQQLLLSLKETIAL